MCVCWGWGWRQGLWLKIGLGVTGKLQIIFPSNLQISEDKKKINLNFAIFFCKVRKQVAKLPSYIDLLTFIIWSVLEGNFKILT